MNIHPVTVPNSLPLTIVGLIPIFSMNHTAGKHDHHQPNETVVTTTESEITTVIIDDYEDSYPVEPQSTLKPNDDHGPLRVELPDLGAVIGILAVGFVEPYHAFLGIPYAEPPVKSLRFANPLLTKPWKTLHAYRPKPACIQKNYILGVDAPIVGDEDCLYLNIYRPMNAKNLPVMVYIPGDDFPTIEKGSHFLGPQYFMDNQRVILVVIQYRLGALGFLSTNDHMMPGNFGLKDQQLALKFVKMHIKHFGGDPKRITIFGHGFGAVSCHLHLLSTASLGLFQAAILMSGTALSPFNEPIKDPLEQAVLLAKQLGITQQFLANTTLLVENLRKVDAAQIVEAGNSFRIWNNYPIEVFKNVIEPHYGHKPFLTRHPLDIYKHGNFHFIPLMITFVENEGATRTLRNMDKIVEMMKTENSKIFIISLLLETRSANESSKEHDFIKNVTNRYLHNKNTATNIEKLITDFGYNYPLYKTIKLHLKHFSNESIHLMKFDYKSEYSVAKMFTKNGSKHQRENKQSVIHGDDVLFLFRTSHDDLHIFDKDSPEHIVSKQYVNEFVTFAETTELATKCNLHDLTVHVNEKEGICWYQKYSAHRDRSLEKKHHSQFDGPAMLFWESIMAPFEEKIIAEYSKCTGANCGIEQI